MGVRPDDLGFRYSYDEYAVRCMRFLVGPGILPSPPQRLSTSDRGVPWKLLSQSREPSLSCLEDRSSNRVVGNPTVEFSQALAQRRATIQSRERGRWNSPRTCSILGRYHLMPLLRTLVEIQKHWRLLLVLVVVAFVLRLKQERKKTKNNVKINRVSSLLPIYNKRVYLDFWKFHSTAALLFVLHPVDFSSRSLDL